VQSFSGNSPGESGGIVIEQPDTDAQAGLRLNLWLVIVIVVLTGLGLYGLATYKTLKKK
jgi:hypothetical protein